jgi:ribosomal protein L11 methyltransferase
MPYLSLSFDLGERDVEAVEALCCDCGALSVTLSDSRDDADAGAGSRRDRLWPATRVQAFCGADASPHWYRIATGLADAGEVDVQAIADPRREREWLRDFHAMRFGRRLWICPQHEQVTADDAVVVQLDPGLAFGTGTHASTALCLTWLDGHLPPAHGSSTTAADRNSRHRRARLGAARCRASTSIRRR